MVKFFAPLSKVDAEQRHVEGYASTEAVDSEGEVITREAIQGALDGYMQFANLREMHQLKAAGVVKQANVDDKGLYISAKVVDDDAWNKVVEEVYKGFSIGGRATQRDPMNKKRITGLELIEISLVDRPSNPEALIELFRAATMNPSRKAAQVWACGMPGHEHHSEDEATACIVEQDEKFGKGQDAVDLRKNLAQAIDELGPEQLVEASNALAKRKASTKKDDGETREDPAPPPKGGKKKPAKDEKEPPAADGNKKDEPIAEDDKDEAKKADPETFDAKKPEQTEEWKAENEEHKADKDGDGDEDDKAEKEDDGDEEKADKKDDKGDYGSKDDAGYADPGYQEDKKPRYPLKQNGKFSEKRIRAAWNYINKEKNQKPYTAKQVQQIKDRIIAAWKATIDKDGPPSAKEDKTDKVSATTTTEGSLSRAMLNKLGKADGAGDVRKGLSTVASVIYLLQQLDYIKSCLQEEAAIEQDNSPMPGRFAALVDTLASLVKQLLDEEVEEMLNDEEAGDMDTPTYVSYANNAISLAKRFKNGSQVADMLMKAIGDNTGAAAAANLLEAVDLISKADPDTFSAKKPDQTQDWEGHGNSAPQGAYDKWPADAVRKAQNMHDLALQMGATCKVDKAHKHDPAPKEEGDKVTKGSKTEPEKKPTKVEKAVVENDDRLETLFGMVTDIQDTLKSIRKDPRRPGEGTPKYRIVGKADDVDIVQEQVVKAPDPQTDPEGYRQFVLKSALSNPNRFVR